MSDIEKEIQEIRKELERIKNNVLETNNVYKISFQDYKNYLENRLMMLLKYKDESS